MRKHTKKSVFQYALIVCLGVTLLLGQVFKLHMHIQHDETPSSATVGHIMDVHIASSHHDTLQHGTHHHDTPHHDRQFNTHHQDDIQNHHLNDIKVSPDSIVKKLKSLNPYVLLFLIGSIFYCVPRLQSFRWQYLQIKPPPPYYLLHPPLRAPPV